MSAVEPDNERGTATFPLSRGTNIDADGVATEVWYFLHDVSDEDIADELGLAWAGALTKTPEVALGDAEISESGLWTFFGDLPNPVWANDVNPPGIPDVDDDNKSI